MHSTGTMLTTYAFSIALLIGISQGQQWGLDLARDINNIVQQSLAPLHNLNLTPIINEEYQRAWNNSRHRYNGPGYGYGYGTPETGYHYNYRYPGYNYSYNYPGYNYSYSYPGYNYSYSYPGYNYSYSYPSATVSRNFWKDFNERLEADLEPIRNLQRLIEMKSGYDGYTVVKFKPSNRVFLIRNNIMYECTGSLSLDNGQCDGDLKRFEVQKSNENYCFLNSRIMINNHLCFVPKNSGYLVSVVNGEVICKSNDANEPTFLISVDDYKKLCRNVATSADYVYFPNDNINTRNLQCSGVQPKKCTYTEDSITANF